jgi:hypothetical protein
MKRLNAGYLRCRKVTINGSDEEMEGRKKLKR